MEFLSNFPAKSHVTTNLKNVASVAKNGDIDNIYIPGFRKSYTPDIHHQLSTVRSSTKRNSLSLTAKIR